MVDEIQQLKNDRDQILIEKDKIIEKSKVENDKKSSELEKL
jgi:hypothetical protein